MYAIRSYYEKGIDLLEKSVNLLQVQDGGLEIRGVYSQQFLGVIARLRGDYAKAKRILEEIAESLRVADNSLDNGYTLRELGYLNIRNNFV